MTSVAVHGVGVLVHLSYPYQGAARLNINFTPQTFRSLINSAVLPHNVFVDNNTFACMVTNL